MRTPVDRGSVLVEALVSLVITATVCLITSASIVTSLRSEAIAHRTLDRAQSVAALSFALERDARASDDLVIGDDVDTPTVEIVTFRADGHDIATYQLDLDHHALIASHPDERDLDLRDVRLPPDTGGTDPPASVEVEPGRVSLLVHFADGTLTSLTASRPRS